MDSALGGRLKHITANGPPQLSGAIINTNKTRLHPSSRIQVLSSPSPGQRLLIFMVTKFFKEKGQMASIVFCLSLSRRPGVLYADPTWKTGRKESTRTHTCLGLIP